MIRHTDYCKTRLSEIYDCNCGANKGELEELHKADKRSAAQTEKEHLMGMRDTYRDGDKNPTDRNPKYIWRSDLKSGIEYPEFNQNKMGTSESKVDHPYHYNHTSIECIDVVEHFNFNKGNAIKYIWRSDLKNGIEDLEKAKWYITREIERIKNENQARSGL